MHDSGSHTASIVVAGSYNAGLTIYGERLPTTGETVLGTRFEAGPGGKGANQAIGIARLGGTVALAAKVGEDMFGAEARASLAAEGLPSSGILVGAEPTGMALILVDSSGDNMISVAPGANLELSSEDVLRTLPQELEACSYVLCQLECPLELAVELATWAKAHQKRMILNPAPARPLSATVLPLFHLVTPNEVELAALTRPLGVTSESPEVQAKALVDCGVDVVVATLGERGAMLVTASGTRTFGAYPVAAVDTTGAGDAFTAGLVAALARGASTEEAVDEGCRAGAFCVTKPGVIDGLATREALDSTVPSRR
jgi:ribokinase